MDGWVMVVLVLVVMLVTVVAVVGVDERINLLGLMRQ